MEDVFNRNKIAMILNYIIVVFVIIATITMFTGFKFMYGQEQVLESSTFGMFRFFTVDSNLLMGFTALLLAIQEKKLLMGKINKIPKIYYILKLMGTVSVTLTILVTISYLGTIAPGGIISLLQNSNLFYHLIIPLLSIIAFCFFEKTNIIKLKDTIYGVIPMFIYGLYYLVNILIHIENGKVSIKYDWYWFVQKDINQIYVIFPLIFIITFIISIILWIINKTNKK